MADTLKVNKEKKIEIIQYCIDHDHDYKGTAEFYGGNYAQIYNWVKKLLMSILNLPILPI